MPKLEIDHVLRPLPPWRDEAMTECGLPADGMERVIPRSELISRLRDLGRQRTYMLTCVTCINTANRWRTWEERPSHVLARDVDRFGGAWGERSVLDDELLAVAALIEAHPEEFHGYVEGLADTSSLDAARRRRRREPRQVNTVRPRPL